MDATEFWQSAALGILALLVAVLGFIGKGALSDIKKKADKDDLKDALAMLRNAIERQSDTNVEVAKAIGELKGEIHARRDK